MKIEITGAFSTCAKAQEAVCELEFAGITGEEVEVITDAVHDARDPKANFSDSKSTDSNKKASPEFSPTKQHHPGRTLIIVRSSDARFVDRITGPLRQHGAENVSNSGDPPAKMHQDKPETTPARAIGATASGPAHPALQRAPTIPSWKPAARNFVPLASKPVRLRAER